MELLKNYNESLQAIYDHVGFIEDWVVCPIDDCTTKFWNTFENTVKYADSKDEFYSENGNCYIDEIYKQRFYKKWIYIGELFTMVFCDPHVDGMKWFRIFDNTKKIENQLNQIND